MRAVFQTLFKVIIDKGELFGLLTTFVNQYVDVPKVFVMRDVVILRELADQIETKMNERAKKTSKRKGEKS